MSQTFSIKSNLIIKDKLPEKGVLCANPERAERIANYFPEKKLICCSWGIKIYTAKHKDIELFIGYVPMGGAGSGLAYFEAYAAGAEVIVRYGSDDSKITNDDLYNFTLVECADNLVGIPAAMELSSDVYREMINADPMLVEAFKASAPELDINVRRAICHHVEDYHFYRFPELITDEKNRESVLERLALLESRRPDLNHCRDMESAALFFRAKQFNKKAITVLQSVLKPSGDERAYTGEGGDIARSLEKKFLEWILVTFENLELK